MYVNQSLCVKWNNVMSDQFSATNGVKQGGVVSPTLFCIYVDDLLMSLKESGYGCRIGLNFYGCFGYADDIVLLSPTYGGMRAMLNISAKYTRSHNIVFNAKKGQVIFFPCKRGTVAKKALTLNNDVLEYVQEAKHLGHSLSSSVIGAFDMSYVCASFNKSVNIMLATFGNVSSCILLKLFNQYCSSLYGIALCDITSKQFKMMQVLWRKAMRRICNLPARTHNVLLPCITDIDCLDFVCIKRIAKFFYSLYHSKNDIVHAMAKRCISQSVSNMGKNVSFISNNICDTEFTIFKEYLM